MSRNRIYPLQVLLGVVYLSAGVAKLAGASIMVQAFEAIGLGQGVRIAVGSVEVIGGLCFFVPRAAMLAAAVLACTVVGMAGATIGHVASLGMARPEPELPHSTVWKTYRANLLESGRPIELPCRSCGPTDKQFQIAI